MPTHATIDGATGKMSTALLPTECVLRFEQTQATPAALWIVNHNLGSKPNARVYSPGGVEMLAEVIHISNNQIQVVFDAPTTGFVVCS
jgi:hypothetical protein